MVREVQHRAVWATNDKGVHVGQFGAVWNFDGFQSNGFRESVDAPGGGNLRFEDPLVHHQRPLRSLFDQRMHGLGSVQFEAARVEGFPTKQPEAVHVAKVCVGQNHRRQWGVAPHAELFPEGARRINEVTAAVFIGDAEAHRIAYVRWLQSLTA